MTGRGWEEWGWGQGGGGNIFKEEKKTSSIDSGQYVLSFHESHPSWKFHKKGQLFALFEKTSINLHPNEKKFFSPNEYHQSWLINL